MAYISASGIGSAVRTAASAASRRPAAALLAGLATIGACPGPSVEVDLSGLRSARGIVRACLTADPAQFPDCQSDPAARRLSVPAGTPTLRFGDLASGSYAVALIHDENGNGRLDTFAGIPREGFGFSRNPAIGFGPPSFASARFALGNDASTQAVKVRYLL